MAEDDVNESDAPENEDGEAEGGDEKSGNKKKLVLILIPLLLLVIGGGLFFSGVFGGGEEEVAAIEEGIEGDGHADGHDDDHASDATNAAFFTVPDLIVNLSSDTGARFLKLKVQLEIADETNLPAIEAVTPRVIDQFQTYLREMRVEDLRGSAGIYRLRQELLYRVNIAAHPVNVTDVLFQEMLIQ
jgi:flagellar FliL protein